MENNHSELRGVARRRIQERRDFFTHFVVYVIVNAFIVFVNLTTTPDYFWAVWPMAGWGIGLFIHFFTVFIQKEITDEDIDKEIEKMKIK